MGLKQLFDGQWTVASSAAPAGKIRRINMGVPINNHIRFSFVLPLSASRFELVYLARAGDAHGFHPLAWSSSLTFRAKAKSKIVSSGGGSLSGGQGTVTGTIIGALIMGVLSNGANLLGISSFTQQIVIGAVIVLAVTFDEFQRRRLETAAS